MFCMECGSSNEPSAKFCSKCGIQTCGTGNVQSAATITAPASAVSFNPNALSGKHIVGGLIVGVIGIWIAAGGLSSASTHSAPESAAAPAAAQAPAMAVPSSSPGPAAAPMRTYRTVAGGAPLCNSFNGAITASAVMRSGNPMVIDAVLSRHGCETSPKSIELDPDSSVQDLQAGIVVINTPSGDRVYTTGSSIGMIRH